MHPNLTHIQQMSRPEIVKKLWAHIKQHDLQDPADRRFILCDDALRTLFNVDRVNSFAMNKDLTVHVSNKPPASPVKAEEGDTDDVPTPTCATTPLTGTTAGNVIPSTSPAATDETPDVVTPTDFDPQGFLLELCQSSQ